MSPTLDAFLGSWPSSPWLVAALLVASAIYGWGWLALRRRNPGRWHRGRLAAYQGGLLALFLAFGSPVEPFGSLLLQVHMIQHLLIMMVAPPLLWLGAPLLPMIRGIPGPIRAYWVAPVLRSKAVRSIFARLSHPAPALILYVGATWLWHAPGVYEAALRSNGLHRLQHFCFLGASLLFWFPVVRPDPARPRWSPWLLLPYLLIADVSNTVLSALLTFSDRLLYPHYGQIPRVAGISALDDQATAGVLMWVPGSVAFLLPLFGIGTKLLFGGAGDPTLFPDAGADRSSTPLPLGEGPGVRVVADPFRARTRGASGDADDPHPRPLCRGERGGRGAASGLGEGVGSSVGGGRGAPAVRSFPTLPILEPNLNKYFDLLIFPILGPFLRWRHSRIAVQVVTTALAGVVIADGLLGPRVSAMNLAGVLPWVHWRGVVVLGLLAVGNVSCMACPFLAPRTLARRWLPASLNWPRWLRSKWLGVALVALFFWAYEAFSLWDSPRATAWIVVGYFAVALAVDGLFRGASFCKYLCPIGQFNFVQSLVSPMEVRAKDSGVCRSCRTKECIRGSDAGLRGCELELYLPQKAGNLDCTFCLDCVHACPHENVGILVAPPGRDLWNEARHSGIGRLKDRPDLAALVLVLVFAAFANAGGMVAPVQDWQGRLSARLGLDSPLAITTSYYLLALVAAPVLAFGLATAVDRRWGERGANRWESATRFSYSLVPLGFAMWLSHYSFHLLTGGRAVIPAAQRFAEGLGWHFLGSPEWLDACCRPAAEWLPRLEIVWLDLGLLLSLYAGCRIARGRTPAAWRAFVPWAFLIVLLFAAGVWIVLQPMQMRGTLARAG